ncbi:MAG: hypothetical protein AABX70_05470 [Nanoarchaeota archaeon]
MTLESRIREVTIQSGNCWQTALYLVGLAPYGFKGDMEDAKSILSENAISVEGPSVGDIAVLGQVDNRNFEHMAVVTEMGADDVKVTHRHFYQGPFKLNESLETFRRGNGYTNSNTVFYKIK